MFKGIKKFFKSWKLKGFKKTWQELQYNYFMLDTPITLLKKEIIGYATNIAGLLLIIIIFVLKNWYYALIAVAAGMFIQWVVLKGKMQQYYSLKKLEVEQQKYLEEMKDEEFKPVEDYNGK